MSRLARFKSFSDGFSETSMFHKHKINSGIAPLFKVLDPLNKDEREAAAGDTYLHISSDSLTLQPVC